MKTVHPTLKELFIKMMKDLNYESMTFLNAEYEYTYFYIAASERIGQSNKYSMLLQLHVEHFI